MATPADAPPAGSSPDRGARERADRFCQRFGLRVPILQAPMAGACPTSLASAVANAGGMGGLGALTTSPDGIATGSESFGTRAMARFRSTCGSPARLRSAIPTMSARCGNSWDIGARPCRRKPAMPCRSTLRCNAKRCLWLSFLDHGSLPGEICRRHQGPRHRLVRLYDHTRRSPRGRCRGP